MKSVLFTYSNTRLGVLDCGSRTTSSSWMTLGPPHRFCRILISRLICARRTADLAAAQQVWQSERLPRAALLAARGRSDSRIQGRQTR